MYKSKHDQIAESLAIRFHTEFKENKGIDLVTPEKVIEVEVHKNELSQGIDQVQNSSKSRYIAVPSAIKNEALVQTKGTGIGVMTERGKIVKKASR
jgi:hypothetical protein